MIDADLKRLKNIQLEMFDVFVDVCKNLSLNYYLIGGTLLGAVRHKGFIPWDDDIDVGMLRKDYEVFINEAQTQLPGNMFLQTYETDVEYPMGFAKLRRCDTTYIETSSAHLKINHGIYLDIFPLDYYPENYYNQLLWKLKFKLISSRISILLDVNPDKKISVKEKIIREIALLKYPSTQAALRNCNIILKRTPKSKLIRNYFGAWGKKEIVPLDWLGAGSRLMFEGREVNAPQEWDLYLRHIYGEYMELPPVEQRTGHHYVTVADLDNSYLKYTGGGFDA